jgi:hypothetical protein
MLKQTVTLGLLAAAALATCAGTAQAGEANANSTVIQSNKQEAVNIGNFNSVFQTNSQVGIDNVGAFSSGAGAANANSGLVQTSEQTGVNIGDYNSVVQHNNQADVQNIYAGQTNPYFPYPW